MPRIPARRLSCLALLLCLCLLPAVHAQSTTPSLTQIPVKVVIVTTFEVGSDTGDAPGEFQYWVEREHLDRTLPFPGGVHDLRANADGSVIGMVGGTTLVPITASVMALGLDPRFDLTHAYWLVAGIAGVDPSVASIGSAAWARWAVSDISREIDPREAPSGWPYGIFAIGATQPNVAPDPRHITGNAPRAYELNTKLADWAFHLTKDVPLMDTPAIAERRALWTGYPNAQRPPFVLEGDTIGSDFYWHGKYLTRWAEDWVRLHTHGQGRFVMTDMEDQGVAEALLRLQALHRADYRRLLVLRTGSNFCMQVPGWTAEQSVTSPYIGGIAAFENTWRVGSPVVRALTANWPVYRDHIPGD